MPSQYSFTRKQDGETLPAAVISDIHEAVEEIALWSSGVDGDGVQRGLAVTAQTPTPSMNLDVASGFAFLDGEGLFDGGGTVTIGAADPTNPRLDLVVFADSGVQTGDPAVVAGTAATAPKPPTPTANQIPLAVVLVEANATSITSDKITDVRAFTARVGVRANSAGDVYARRRINFVPGTNMTSITVADDPTDEEVDVTFNAATQAGGTGYAFSGIDLPGSLVRYTVSDATTLRTRIEGAIPGDVIGVTAGTYNFATSLIANDSGTISHPIYLVALEPGVLFQGPDMTTNTQLLRIQADFWRVIGINMRQCHSLLWIYRGNHNVVRGCELYEAGGSLLHIKGLSRFNLVEHCVLHDSRQNTAISQPSEGVYVGTTKSQWASLTFGLTNNGTGNAADPDDSSFNIVRHNLIYNTYTENIEFKEGTRGNVAYANTLDGTGLRTDSTSECANISCKGNFAKIHHNFIRRPGQDAIKFPNADDNVAGWGSNNWCGPNVYDWSNPVLAGGVKVDQGSVSTGNRVHPLQHVIAGTDPGIDASLSYEADGTYEVG